MANNNYSQTFKQNSLGTWCDREIAIIVVGDEIGKMAAEKRRNGRLDEHDGHGGGYYERGSDLQ